MINLLSLRHLRHFAVVDDLGHFGGAVKAWMAFALKPKAAAVSGGRRFQNAPAGTSRLRPSQRRFQENSNMRLSHRFRAGLVTLIAVVGGVSSAAYADSALYAASPRN
jgi:hypothetical protein